MPDLVHHMSVCGAATPQSKVFQSRPDSHAQTEFPHNNQDFHGWIESHGIKYCPYGPLHQIHPCGKLDYFRNCCVRFCSIFFIDDNSKYEKRGIIRFLLCYDYAKVFWVIFVLDSNQIANVFKDHFLFIWRMVHRRHEHGITPTIQQGFTQKRRQRSSLLLGGQNCSNSLPR